MKRNILLVLCIGFITLAGCGRVSPTSVQAATDPNAAATSDAAATPAAAPSLDIPAGTNIRVRLLETLDTRRNRAGDRFTASLDEPLVSGDRVVVPKGTSFNGHIVQCKPSGRFKGRAVMALRLDSFAVNGQVYDISSNSSGRVSKGHKKHNFAWIGGGAGGGAALGAIAGGGPGALIGAGAGAAAGTVGSVVTGRRNVSLPVETTLRFRLQAPISVGG
jgi:hypothetical protein